MLLEKSEEIAPAGMKRLSQSGNNTQLGVCLSGESKVRCCKEQYCVGTWNVMSMNQGKLEVFKQEMARVNIDILGINEVKWTGMEEFNSDDHYICYCGQESLRRNGIDIIVNKRVRLDETKKIINLIFILTIWWFLRWVWHLFGCLKRVFAVISLFSWQNC